VRNSDSISVGDTQPRLLPLPRQTFRNQRAVFFLTAISARLPAYRLFLETREAGVTETWQEQLLHEWPVHRDLPMREWLLTTYEDKIATLTQREQEALFERLSAL
jgi:hypothetical protein